MSADLTATLKAITRENAEIEKRTAGLRTKRHAAATAVRSMDAEIQKLEQRREQINAALAPLQRLMNGESPIVIGNRQSSSGIANRHRESPRRPGNCAPLALAQHRPSGRRSSMHWRARVPSLQLTSCSER